MANFAGTVSREAFDQRGPVRRRGLCDVSRASFGRRGLGCGSARMPVTARQRLGAFGGKRVVTGAKIGLRASRGKGFANRNLRAALVTGWYGAAIHGAATGSVIG